MKKYVFFFLFFVCVLSCVFSQYTFKISTGTFTANEIIRGGTGSLAAWTDSNARAGAIGYVNDINSVDKKNLGPIPPGTYEIIGVRQTLHGNQHQNVIVLNRIRGDALGRDNDFMIHGSRSDEATSGNNGSNGCILMSPTNRQKIADAFRECNRLGVTLTLVVIK